MMEAESVNEEKQRFVHSHRTPPPALQEPLAINMTIRDGNYTRLGKIEEKRPEDVVRMLNSILRKANSKKRLMIIEIPDTQVATEDVASE